MGHPQPRGKGVGEALARPAGAEPFAFQMQEGDLVQRVESPQAGVEFEAVDDRDRPDRPDMLRPQIAMSVDDPSSRTLAARASARASKKKRGSRWAARALPIGPTGKRNRGSSNTSTVRLDACRRAPRWRSTDMGKWRA